MKYKRNPAKLVVGFSWTKVFNETIAMDLGEIEQKKFLVIVDTAIRYSQAYWIKDKNPEVIIRAICSFAVFGAPLKILSYYGENFRMKKLEG